jgi:hypothetical protein
MSRGANIITQNAVKNVLWFVSEMSPDSTRAEGLVSSAAMFSGGAFRR